MKVSQKFLQFAGLAIAAEAAGLAAGEAAVPVPMVVQEQQLFGNAVGKAYFVEGGACGFAWINIRPGTSAFAKWMVKQGFARKAYEGGVQVWVSEFGQSMQRKEAYARAYAEVLQAHGITAYAGSRMD